MTSKYIKSNLIKIKNSLVNNNIIMYFTDVLTFIVDLNSELYQYLFIRVFCLKRKLVFQVRSLLNHYFGFFLYFSHRICSRTKKLDFSAEISPKNRFSACMEKIFTKNNRKSKNRRKIGKIVDFSPKNRKIPIFPPKNRECGACASQARFGQKNRR